MGPDERQPAHHQSGLAWFINPEHGWTELVHALSHYVHQRKSDGTVTPHHWKHVTIEARMVRTVARRGLMGKAARERLCAAQVPKSGQERIDALYKLAMANLSGGPLPSTPTMDEALEMCARARKLTRRKEQIARLERRISYLTTLLKKRQRSMRALQLAVWRYEEKYPEVIVPTPPEMEVEEFTGPGDARKSANCLANHEMCKPLDLCLFRHLEPK